MARSTASTFTGAQTEEVLIGLSSSSHLTRDRAVLAISSASAETLSDLCVELPALLESDNAWNIVTAALQASSSVLDVSTCTLAEATSFARSLLPKLMPLISHPETRVRSATAKLCGDVARVLGATVWAELSPALLANVEHNINLDEQQRLKEAQRVARKDMAEPETSPRERGLRMIHETEGWRGLETTLLTVAEIVSGCGKTLFASSSADTSSVPGLDATLNYVDKAKYHPNRFIREAGLRLFTAIADACVAASAIALLEIITQRLKDVIARGLQDNWSQVRYNASVVARKVMSGLPTDVRRSFYSLLLPRMCLNRHYVAEGVRTYSQETWKRVIGGDGRYYLVQHLDQVVAYYESQCSADNHAVREAACQGFAEVTSKLDCDAIRRYIPAIVNALMDCFKDESWPVRDHACVALADVTVHFASEVESTGRLQELLDLLIAHLADNIASVRENSARALVKTSIAFPLSHPVIGLKQVGVVAAWSIPRILEQAERKFATVNRPDRDTGYGAAAKVARDNDVELHTGQVMYSCGSLAPKLRRGGGCMDHGFSRPKEPWEETDGGVRLWRYIAETGGEGLVMASDLFDAIVSAFRIAVRREFAHCVSSQETFWINIAIVTPLLPRQLWTQDVLGEVATLADICSKSSNARVSSSAKSAIRAIRQVCGLQVYEDARKSFQAAHSGDVDCAPEHAD